jgi:hypothetical protein
MTAYPKITTYYSPGKQVCTGYAQDIYVPGECSDMGTLGELIVIRIALSHGL